MLWMIRRERELNNWIDNYIFEVVSFEKQTTLFSHWIISEKYKDGKKKTKVRLVAHSFEEDTNNLRKDPPTCSRECLCLFLTATLMS